MSAFRQFRGLVRRQLEADDAIMAVQPSGTVTLVFTDIEGSTRLLHELGQDAYREALAAHRHVVREAFAGRGGYEVDYEGDAFFYAFSAAGQAVAAVSEAIGGLEGGPIRIRVGIHTGEPGLDPPKYVGMDVHLAARVMSVGHGGQVLVTRSARDLVDEELLDLGEHRLKDIVDPVWLYQLGQGEFPPLKSLNNTNLPTPASSFLGRESELDEADRLIADCRLLTVSGPGGAGKTRFAIELASRELARFPNGVFWVPLAALRDPGLVPETIAQTLGAKNGLAEHIGERRMLLVLDNLEQVITAAPELSKLLAECPRLAMLVTSRELLRVRGEVEFALPPLVDREAVELFCTRAGSISDPTVERICQWLEGLPLAIELAAARMAVFTPEELLDRIGRRLDLLRGGRDADPRQQTLRAAIQWSFDLLDDREALLFRRLAVFAGGCTFATAEEVCGADADTLQGLVEKSLVCRTYGRFWMLETNREFAVEGLADSGEQDAVSEAHAQHFLALAEAAEVKGEAYTPDWLERLDAERDNFRAALRWALDAGRAALALRLASALGRLWVIRAPREGYAWLSETVEKAQDAPKEMRARGLMWAGSAVFFTGDYRRSLELEEEALDLFRQLGDKRMVARTLVRVSSPTRFLGDPDRARALVDESIALYRELGDRSGSIYPLSHIALDEWLRGNRERGVSLAEEALELAREAGDAWWQVSQLEDLAMMAWELGDLCRAYDLAKEQIRLGRELGSAVVLLYGLALLAGVAAKRGDAIRAGRLWGAVEAYEERGAATFKGEDRARYLDAVSSLAGHDLEAGLAEGRAMTLDEALRHTVNPTNSNVQA
jgi:predicted ATPase/class 3 adenylate cyclase